MQSFVHQAYKYYKQNEYIKALFIYILLSIYTNKTLFKNNIKIINNKIYKHKNNIKIIDLYNFIILFLQNGFFLNDIINTINFIIKRNINTSINLTFNTIKKLLINKCINNPILSIIIPTYNSSNYIYKCLNSIVKQNFISFEVICIDDSSKDNTVQIIDFFTKKDSRFFLIKQQENLGAGISRNLGLEYARGKFITFLDSDDQYYNTALKDLIFQIKSTNSDVVVCSVSIHSEYSKCSKNLNLFLNESLLKNKNLKEITNFDSYIFQIFNAWCWNKLFKRDLIKYNNIKFQKIKNSEDNLFVYKAIICSKTISFLNKNLIKHYNRNNSLENTKFFAPYCFIEALLELEAYLIKINLYKKYEKSFINKICDNFLYNLNKLYKDSHTILDIELICKYIEHFNIFKYDINYFYNKNNYKYLLNLYKQQKSKSIDLSILITFYNQRQYIKECINSILSQNTNFSFEILIALDGDDDGSWEILKNYFIKYKNIKIFKVFSDKNLLSLSRASQNRLFLLKHAVGNFFITLDGDDFFYDKNRFEEGLNFLKHNNNFIGHLCKHNIYNDKNKQFIFLKGNDEILTLEKYIKNKRYTPASCGIFHNIFKKEKYPYKYFFNDTSLMFYMLSKGKIFFSGKSMFSYRKGIISTFSSKDEDNKKFLSFAVDIYKYKIKKNKYLKNKLTSDFNYFINTNTNIETTVCQSVKYQNLQISKDIISFYECKAYSKLLNKIVILLKFKFFIYFPYFFK